MADLNFVSPGAQGGNALVQFLMQRALQQRQAMLDAQNAQEQDFQQGQSAKELGLRQASEARLAKEQDAAAEQAKANAADIASQREFQRASTIHENALPGNTDQATYDLLTKNGLGDIASKVPGIVAQGAQTGTDENGVPQYAVNQAPDTFKIAGGSRYQGEQIAAKQRTEEAAAARADADAQRELDRQARADIAKLAGGKSNDGVIPVQTVGPNGEAVTQYMTKADALKQGTFAKPQGQTVQNRLESAKAVQDTGGDIIKELSDPAFASQVGPVLGRYKSVQDFIGNPPPEYAQLAGQIESYALASMGVHGMRSAQGAQMIRQLLDQKHTPQALIGSIQGLNAFSQHFIENTKPAGATAPSTASGSGFKVVASRPVK